MNKDSFIYGSIIMLFMNIIIRIIAFSYEVFLSRLLGAEGVGLYQIAMSTIMTFLMITISGIPTSVTRLTAEHNSRNDYATIEAIYRYTILFNFIISLILCSILFVLADFISINIFKNKDMLIGTYLLAPGIILISISHVIRGYYYGLKNIMTPSIGEICEQSTRFIIVIFLLYYLKPTNPATGAVITILGISIGEIFNILWTTSSKKRIYKYKLKRIGSIKILPKVLLYALPLSITGFVNIILRFSNIILIPNRLMASGYSNSEAIATLGRITGMAIPLLSLPYVVTFALVTNLIPNLTEKKALNKNREIEADILLSLKMTFLVSIPLTVLYITLSKSIAIFLYNDLYVAEIIRIMGFGTILMAVEHVYTGMLYGLNKNITIMINNIVGMIIRIVITYVLVGNPQYGLNGFYIAFYLSDITITLLNILTLRSIVKIKVNYIDMLGKPLIASVFMIGFLYLSNFSLENLQYSNPIAFVSNLVIASFAYFFILIITRAIPKKVFTKKNKK